MSRFLPGRFKKTQQPEKESDRNTKKTEPPPPDYNDELHTGLLDVDLHLQHDQVIQMFTYDVDSWFDILFAVHGRTFPWRPWLLIMTITVSFLLIHENYWALAGDGFDNTVSKHVHSTFGIVLGFLIVYQSSQSSQRWWEARVSWENIITHSREAMRILCAHCNGRELIKLFGKYIIAFSVTSKHYLRHEEWTVEKPCPELAKILPPIDVERLYKCAPRHRPLACLFAAQRISEIAISKGLIARAVSRDINPRFVTLADNLGACERILYTPMPWVYTLHLRLIMFCYLTFLPLMFAGIKGPDAPDRWFIVTFCSLLSYAFLGLEDMAVQIQMPFGESVSDLPLDYYLQQIQDDTVETIELKYAMYGEDFSLKLEDAVFKSNIRHSFDMPNKRIWGSDLARQQQQGKKHQHQRNKSLPWTKHVAGGEIAPTGR